MDPKYDLYDEDYGGGIMGGEKICQDRGKASGSFNGNKPWSNRHPGVQVLLSVGLWSCLINYERSKEMLELMADPELHHKFVGNLERIAPKARLYRKSGTWKNFHADSVLVWGPETEVYPGCVD